MMALQPLAPAATESSAGFDRSIETLKRLPAEQRSQSRAETPVQIDPSAASEKIAGEERRRQETVSPPYRVDIDPDTRRLFTEVLHPRTGAVILRIPSKPVSEPPPVSTIAEPAPEVTAESEPVENGASRLEGRLL